MGDSKKATLSGQAEWEAQKKIRDALEGRKKINETMLYHFDDDLEKRKTRQQREHKKKRNTAACPANVFDHRQRQPDFTGYHVTLRRCEWRNGIAARGVAKVAPCVFLRWLAIEIAGWWPTGLRHEDEGPGLLGFMARAGCRASGQRSSRQDWSCRVCPR